MTSKEYISRANDLLERISALESSAEDYLDFLSDHSYSDDVADVVREFIHLVYAFDKNIPLLEEIKPMLNGCAMLGFSNGNGHFFSKLRNGVNFFIRYVDTYCG